MLLTPQPHSSDEASRATIRAFPVGQALHFWRFARSGNPRFGRNVNRRRRLSTGLE